MTAIVKTDYLIIFLFVISIMLSVLNFIIKPREDKLKIIADAKEKINTSLLALMYQARENFKDGEGNFKLSEVIKNVLNSPFYISLPTFAKLIINEQLLTSLINSLYDKYFKNK